MRIVALILFLISTSAFSDTFNINLMGFFQTQNVYRGAQIWPRGSGLIAPGFQFFDRKLSLNGPNLNYAFFPKDSLFKFDTGIRYWDDDKPFIELNKGEEDYRNQRDYSLEYYIKSSLSFGWKDKFDFGFYLGRDLVRYRAFYGDIHLKIPVLPFTSIVTKVSLAQGDTNRYLYGPEAVSGIGYGSLTLRFVMPFVPWDGIIINSLEKSWIFKGANKAADYVRGNDDHLTFSTRWIWNVF